MRGNPECKVCQGTGWYEDETYGSLEKCTYQPMLRHPPQKKEKND